MHHLLCISLAIVLLLAGSVSWGADAPGDAGSISTKFLKDLQKAKPTATTIDVALDFHPNLKEVRSYLFNKLEINAPGYISAGIAGSATKTSIVYRAYWSPLVYACLIDHPTNGQKILSQVLLNPKVPIRVKAWILSVMADLATAGASWSWLDQEALLPIIEELAVNDFEVWRFLTSEKSAHLTPRIESPISTKLLAVIVLRILYGVDVGPDFVHFEKNDPLYIASRAAAVAKLGDSIQQIIPRAHLNANTQAVLANWPVYSFGPQQRLALAKIHIGSLRADVASLQLFALMALSESARNPIKDEDVVHEYLDAVRRIHESDILLTTIIKIPPPPEARIPDYPNAVDLESTRAWLLAAVTQISKRVLPQSPGGIMSSEFETALGAIRTYTPK